jgi:MtN3 and saliva related transmembrane protein
MLATLIGTVAGTLTTSAYLPQMIRVWRSRSAGDISLLMCAMMVTGASLWVVYGLMLSAWPVVMANGVSLFFLVPILVLKLRYS